MTPDGLNEKHKALQVSDLVRSLVMFEDGGLAAGTLAGTFDLFSISAVTPDGPNEKYKTLQASDSVYSLVGGLPMAPLRALSIYSKSQP